MATGGNPTKRKQKPKKHSEDPLEFPCFVCADKDVRTEARKYCVQCQNYYCDECVKLHTILPTMSGHSVVGKADFKSIGKEPKLPSVPTERCRDHNTKLADLYCETHDKVGCGTCMILNHQQCKVLYIPDSLDQLFRPEKVKDAEQQLDKVIKDIKDAISLRTKNVGLVKQLKSRAVLAISNFKLEISRELVQIEKASLSALDLLCNSLEREFEKDSHQLSTYLSESEDIKIKLKKTSKPNIPQRYVCYKYADETIASVTEKLAELVDSTIQSISFQSNKTLLENVKSFNSIGTLTAVRKKDTLSKSQSSTRATERKGYTVIKKHVAYNVHDVADDSDCDISGVCVLQDGTILLSDKSINKLKRVTKRGSSLALKDHIDLPGAAWSVCVIDQRTAAITLPDLKHVDYIYLGDKLKMIRSMDLDYKCFGIAYNKDTLFVSDNCTRVYAYNDSGDLLKSIPATSDNSLFSDIRHLAISENGRLLYVADYEKGLIAIDSSNGKVHWRFDGPELAKVHGVCIDGYGSVFACGYESDNVLQISEKGEIIAELLTGADDVVFPRSVCFDQQRSLLILTQWNSDEVKLYDMQKQ